MRDLKELYNLPLFSNTWLAWSLALAIALASFLILWILRRVVRRAFRGLQATEHTELLERPLQVLSRTMAPFLVIETVYYVLSADYNRYMDIQQAINLRLHRELTELGIEFAYPTQKLYLVQPPSSDARPASGGDSDRQDIRAA